MSKDDLQILPKDVFNGGHQPDYSKAEILEDDSQRVDALVRVSIQEVRNRRSAIISAIGMLKTVTEKGLKDLIPAKKAAILTTTTTVEEQFEVFESFVKHAQEKKANESLVNELSSEISEFRALASAVVKQYSQE